MLAALLRVLVLATPVHAVYDTFGGVDCDAVSVQYDDPSDHLCVPKVAAKQVSKGYGSVSQSLSQFNCCADYIVSSY